MIVRPAENSFRRGIAALNAGDRLGALAYFEAALRLDRERSPRTPNMKYLSYYGLCLAFGSNGRQKGIQFCRRAAESEFYNPDIFWNLGRASLMQGDRRSAWNSFRRGLEIDNGHIGLKFQVRRLGLRRAAVLPFLIRSHPINRLAGRLRTHLLGRPDVTAPLAPAARHHGRTPRQLRE